MYTDISLDGFKKVYRIEVVKVGDFYSVLRQETPSKENGGKKGVCLLRNVSEYDAKKFLTRLKREILRNAVSSNPLDEGAFRRVAIEVRRNF